MKKPEIIYLLPDERYPDGLDILWFEAPYCTGYIKYIRTDAFIEKVEEYIYKQLNEGRIECGDIEKFIDEFKKAIKGE